MPCRKVPSSDTVLRQSENEKTPLRANFGDSNHVTLNDWTILNEEPLCSPDEQALEKDTCIDAFSDQRENAFNPVMDIPSRNSESTPIPEEETAQSEENSLNVDTRLKEDALERSNPTPGVYSRFKRRRRPKVRPGPEDTVQPESAWTTPRWRQAT